MIIKPVERFLAFRYLRARRAEGFISVIAWFSFLGITLGVATLVIVMSVMNGFRAELIDRILGLNGHIGVFKTDGRPIEKYNESCPVPHPTSRMSLSNPMKFLNCLAK